MRPQRQIWLGIRQNANRTAEGRFKLAGEYACLVRLGVCLMFLVGVALASACSAPADGNPEGWTVGSQTDVAGSDTSPGEVVCGEPQDELKRPEEVEAAGLLGCDIYRGTIIYQGHFEVDLSQLSTLRVVEGDLIVHEGYELESLHGLERLERVGGNLHLSYNHMIEDLSPLANLRYVGDALVIAGPHGFADLRGLEQLRHVGHLYVTKSYLRSLDGLDRLETIAGELALYSNDEPIDLTSLSGVSRLEGKLEIRGNETLGGLQGLQNIRSVEELVIAQNPNLQSLDGLAGLERVRGDVFFKENPELPAEEVQALIDRIQVDGEVDVR